MPTNYMKIDGLPVRNLTKKIKLVISEQDCKRGNTKTPNSCAAALAAVRQVPGCTEARIHIGRVFLRVKDKVTKKEYWLRARTPGALRTEIATFDRGGTFEPGVYDINPLPPSDRATGRIQGSAPMFKKGRKGFKRIPAKKIKFLRNVRWNGHREYGTAK